MQQKKNKPKVRNNDDERTTTTTTTNLFCKYCLVHVFTKAKQNKIKSSIKNGTTTKTYIFKFTY